MTSYHDEHNLQSPSSSRSSSTVNPNITAFISSDDQQTTSPLIPNQHRLQQTDINAITTLIQLFNEHRDRIERDRLSDVDSAILVERLIEQLMMENSLRQGPPPTSKKFIAELPSVNVNFVKDSSCPICVSDYNTETVVKQLPCNHQFHAGCIIPWLELHNTCPICRRELPTDDPVYEAKRNQQQSTSQNTQSTSQVVEEDEEDRFDYMYG